MSKIISTSNFYGDTRIEVLGDEDNFIILKAGTLRTSRKIMDGFAYY